MRDAWISWLQDFHTYLIILVVMASVQTDYISRVKVVSKESKACVDKLVVANGMQSKDLLVGHRRF
jgi:hypothetical protein